MKNNWNYFWQFKAVCVFYELIGYLCQLPERDLFYVFSLFPVWSTYINWSDHLVSCQLQIFLFCAIQGFSLLFKNLLMAESFFSSLQLPVCLLQNKYFLAGTVWNTALSRDFWETFEASLLRYLCQEKCVNLHPV